MTKASGDRPRSAQQLLAMVQKYQRLRALNSGEQAPPMGEISYELLSERTDRLVLARWTNPGKRSNYFIPLKHVLPTAQLLGASEADTDDLMVVRLQELADRGDETGAVEAVGWAVRLMGRTVSAEERLLRELLIQARGSYAPEVNLTNLPEKARTELIAHLRRLLNEANAALVEENSVGEAQDDSSDWRPLAAKVKTTLAKSFKRAAKRLRGEAKESLRVRRRKAMQEVRAAILRAQRTARA